MYTLPILPKKNHYGKFYNFHVTRFSRVSHRKWFLFQKTVRKRRTATLRNNVPMINNSISVPLCNGSLIPASMKTIYFAELPARQCRSPFTRSIMIQAVLVLENGRKIDVRSVADIDPGRGEGGGGGGGEDFPVGRFFSVRLDDPDVEDRWRSRVVPRDDLASLVAYVCNYAASAFTRRIAGREPGQKASLSLDFLSLSPLVL